MILNLLTMACIAAVGAYALLGYIPRSLLLATVVLFLIYVF